MFLPQISIKRPVLTVMMSLALVLFGVIGLVRLPVRELPNIDPPVDTLELSRMAETQLKDVANGTRCVAGSDRRREALRHSHLARCASHGGARRDVNDVERALREQNVELPSGRVENLDREMTIETQGELKTAEQFNQLVIRSEGATLVRLRDIGEAKPGPEDLRSISRFNVGSTSPALRCTVGRTLLQARQAGRRRSPGSSRAFLR